MSAPLIRLLLAIGLVFSGPALIYSLMSTIPDSLSNLPRGEFLRAAPVIVFLTVIVFLVNFGVVFKVISNKEFRSVYDIISLLVIALVSLPSVWSAVMFFTQVHFQCLAGANDLAAIVDFVVERYSVGGSASYAALGWCRGISHAISLTGIFGVALATAALFVALVEGWGKTQ